MEPNEALLAYRSEAFVDGGRVLVPLCGMSVDLDWLMHQGHTVVGVEFVPEAVSQLERRFGPPTQVRTEGAFVAWRWGERLTVYQGDFFALGGLNLEPFDGVWDRAALVALAPNTRDAYAELLMSLVRPGGAILLRTFAYDQTAMSGPPFSVDSRLVRSLFHEAELTNLDANRTEPDPKFQERGLLWQSVETWLMRC